MKIIKAFSDNVVTSVATFFHYIHTAISEKIEAIRKRWIMLTFQGSKQINLDHPFLAYAKAKNANLNALRKQAFELLDQENVYLLGESILRIYTTYPKETIEWIIEKHKTWPREKFSHLLQQLKAEFVKHPSYYKLLKKELLKCEIDVGSDSP